MDARDSSTAGHRAIPGSRCTRRRSTMFAAESAMTLSDAPVDCHAKPILSAALAFVATDECCVAGPRLNITTASG